MILAFQETMRQFLDVQRATMRDYLTGRGARSPRPELSPAAKPEITPPPPPPAPIEDTLPAVGSIEGAPSEPPATIASVDPPRHDRDTIAKALVDIVRDRTGYPPEMLRLELDLEADLGIDSIKRVEILGNLRDAFPGVGLGADSAVMDDLARSKTLGAIVERFAKAIGTSRPAKADGSTAIRRLVLEAVPARFEEGRAGLAEGGVVLVTDDGWGVAHAVAAEIEAAGHPVLVVGHGEGPGRCDFTSPGAIQVLLDEARDRGPLAGIVHTLPLQSLAAPGLDIESWASRLGPEVRGLFLLAHAAAGDLERSAGLGGACLIAATGMGGAFGSVGGLPSDLSPGRGGVAGLVKTLAREWPRVRVRVVDFDPDEEADLLAGRLAAEVFAEEARSEVGYRRGRRVSLATREAPFAAGTLERLSIAPGEPLLLTGGARGITASIAVELARRWRPNLLVVGTTPIAGEEEGDATARVTDPALLKAALLADVRRRGEHPSPKALETAFRAILRSREIRGNLAAIREVGASVEYASADVRDARALGSVLDGWRDRFGPPVGLIHGAGVIHDKLLRDKTPESFDRVFGTKVEGALNLIRLLDVESLRFAALFSSIAGRFGNRGQSDYAAANEALNKLALWLDRRIPGRVVSTIWGPWSGVGMVSDLEGHLGRRGLGMIPPEVGRSKFVEELVFGRKGEVEVLLSGSLGSLELPPGPRPSGLIGGAAR